MGVKVYDEIIIFFVPARVDDGPEHVVAEVVAAGIEPVFIKAVDER